MANKKHSIKHPTKDDYGPTESYLYTKPLWEYLDNCYVCGNRCICHAHLIEVNGQQYHAEVCPSCAASYAVA